MSKYKNLTLLHSNDMHGDFLSKHTDQKLLGGVSMLSGYVEKIKSETKNTIYCISGDMLQGSLIDSEFRGISTIEIMNRLGPDIVSLGNHEIDYGLGHLLLLERCAKFPIVNANIFIKNPYTRLFQSHRIMYIDGMKIMFIGIITSEVLSPLKEDSLLGSLIDVEDAAQEVGKICNAYRTSDIDFTVLLTHIGFEEDKLLASLLDPAWGVDVIIGGHSHTVLSEPEEVNGILIVQAGVGTDQIGHFDIIVDTYENCVADYQWKLVPIDSEHCPRNMDIENAILKYKDRIDAKYDQILCRLSRELTHPVRTAETELGNLFADGVREMVKTDFVMIGSGSIRKTAVGPVVTLRDLNETVPYDDKIFRLTVSGSQFKQMYAYMLRDEALQGGKTEFYQFSKGLSVVYDRRTKTFERFDYNGAPLDEAAFYTLGLQSFHQANFDEFFGFPYAEVAANSKPVITATSIRDVIEEFLGTSLSLDAAVEGRLTVLE